jgi:hypothetical protein
MAPKVKKSASTQKSKKAKSKGKSKSKSTLKTKVESSPEHPIDKSLPDAAAAENPWRSVFDVKWVSIGGAEEKKENKNDNKLSSGQPKGLVPVFPSSLFFLIFFFLTHLFNSKLELTVF